MGKMIRPIESLLTAALGNNRLPRFLTGFNRVGKRMMLKLPKDQRQLLREMIEGIVSVVQKEQ